MTGKNSSLLLIGALLLLACSPKRNTYVSRQYNDLTAYFNTLFNGRESYQQGVKRVEAMEPEGFDEILPVFAFEYKNVPGSVASEMQRSIDKSEKMIRERSITAKPKKKRNLTKEQRAFYNQKEFNSWVADAHLLIGQSDIYLHDYSLADEKFTYINAEYSKDEEIVAESRLWQAITAIQTGDFNQAESGLLYLSKSRKFPPHLNPLLNAAFADLYIKQKRYTEAIASLEKALAGTRRKSTKIRYHYILAQLYQKTNNNNQALEHYRRVLKLNPPYFTAFNAEMAMAFSYDPAAHKGAIRKTLEKALKDDRNSDYLDQIYYALAKVEESSGNTDKALSYYRQSIAAKGINNRQKGQSYLALAQYYSTIPDYIRAYTCYDSSARMLGPDHSLYKEVAGEAQRLRKLATNLKVIQHEDSLQKLAGMSASERNKIIEEKVRKSEERALQAQEQERVEQQMRAQADRNMSMNSTVQSTSGQWYFYNPTALNLGASDFEARWGNRKLEDNWRRRNRSITQTNPFDDDDDELEAISTSDQSIEQPVTQKKDVKDYMAEIPIGDEAKKASNSRISQAMFNVGEAYRDDLKNTSAAINTLEDLVQRFPQSEFEAAAFVALYNLYNSLGDTEKSAYYKNLMLVRHPSDPQVLAATDPSYVLRMQQKETAEEGAYTVALGMYSSGNKAGANQAAEKALRDYPGGRLTPQFMLLRAVASEYNGNVQAYQAALTGIVQKYPGSDAAKTAKVLLDEVAKVELQLLSQQPDTQSPDENVVVNYSKDDGVHFFAIVVDATKADLNKLQFNLAAFSAESFLTHNYEVQGMEFGDNTLILVGEMKDKKDAMEYYGKAIAQKDIFSHIASDHYSIFVISDTNMFLFQGSKSVAGYYNFFKANYLK